MGAMSAPAFDTLKAAKQLGAAGFDDAQAEAVIATVAGSASQDVGALKADVGVLKADVETLRVDVQALKLDVRAVKADVELLKADVRGLQVDVQAIKADLQALKLHVAEKFEALYKHLWFMGAGVVAANAGVVTVLITLLT